MCPEVPRVPNAPRVPNVSCVPNAPNFPCVPNVPNISAMANLNHMGGQSHLLLPPPPHTHTHTKVGICWFTSDRSVRSVRLSVPFIYASLSRAFYRAGGQTRDVDSMLG